MNRGLFFLKVCMTLLAAAVGAYCAYHGLWFETALMLFNVGIFGHLLNEEFPLRQVPGAVTVLVGGLLIDCLAGAAEVARAILIPRGKKH